MPTMLLTSMRPFRFKIKRNFIIDLISGLFIVLFVYTSISKLYHFESFENVISKSPLIEGKAHVTARVIPALELLLSILLFFKRILNFESRKWGLLASAILMLLFTLYVAYIMAFAPTLPCSCGGVISSMSWKQHLYFNSIFTLLGTFGFYLSIKESRSLK